MSGIVSIRVDASRAIAGITEDVEQIPFVLALSLTRTVKAGQAKIQKELPEKFTIRKQVVKKGVRIEKATKESLTAVLKDIDDFMYLQDEGLPRQVGDIGFTSLNQGLALAVQVGNMVAIPFEAARPTAGRVVREADTPQAIMNAQPPGFVKSYGTYSVLFRRANGREARTGNVRRGGRDRALVRSVDGAKAVPMWLLVPQAKNTKHKGFFEASFEELIDSGEWERQFEAAFAEAIKE